MTAFESYAKFLIDEAFSNVRAELLGYPELIIKRNLWYKTYVYFNNETLEIEELSTPPEQLVYVYSNFNKYELVNEFVEFK